MQKKVDIILVDDQNAVRSGFSIMLKHAGFNIIDEAGDGVELFPILEKKKPDIILLDLEMPKLNGSECLGRLKKEYPYLRVIIFSQYHDENVIKNCMNRGAKAFISKNHKPEVVFEAIRRVHEFGIYRDNLPFLLKNPSIKDGHYYRLLFTRGEIKLRAHLLNTEQTYEDIALLCSLSKKTIEKRATTIFEKATVKNRGGFIKWAMKSGVNFIAEE